MVRLNHVGLNGKHRAPRLATLTSGGLSWRRRAATEGADLLTVAFVAQKIRGWTSCR